MKKYALKITKLVKIKELLKTASWQYKLEDGFVNIYDSTGKLRGKFDQEKNVGEIFEEIRRMQYQDKKREPIVETIPSSGTKQDITQEVYNKR